MGIEWPDWEAESYPTLEDLAIMAPVFAALFPTIRFLLDRFCFEIVGRRLFQKKHEASTKKLIDDDKIELEKKLVKFKESGWKCVYYLSAEVFALLITYEEPWFWDTKYFWKGPGEQVWPDQKVKFARIGSVVLALHDASDVFLEIAKMNKYAGTPIVPDIFFVLFAVSWVLLRLIYYPFWIIWSTSYEVLQVLSKEVHRGHGPIFYYIFNMLLISLLVLHVYWWILIYRMLVKQIRARGKVGDDVRSGKS
ncbi:hypothetical protein O6H91_Y300800 [Diphasiastrum complanatum]|nr:hypothetical protein O6H91_Y300800 [Diphasiastrum complanatum]